MVPKGGETGSIPIVSLVIRPITLRHLQSALCENHFVFSIPRSFGDTNTHQGLPYHDEPLIWICRRRGVPKCENACRFWFWFYFVPKGKWEIVRASSSFRLRNQIESSSRRFPPEGFFGWAQSNQKGRRLRSLWRMSGRRDDGGETWLHPTF